MSSSSPTAEPAVTATYADATSANAPFTISESVSALPPSSSASPTTSERTAYLARLRTATEAAQARINHELTRRMDDDKAREAAATGKAPLSAEDEAREEQNYGEDVPGEDDD